MKNKRMNVLFGFAAVSTIAIGAICFTGGCKSQPPAKDQTVMPPSTKPVTSQPVPVQQVAAPVAPVATQAVNNAPASTPAIPDIKAEDVKYTVEKGDSFSKIAKKYGVGMQELATYNNMSIQKPLQIGKTLKIPPKAAKQ